MNHRQSEWELPDTRVGRYKVRSHIATWHPRSNDEKIIDLSFRRKRFEVTREGSGPGGRPRMLINGIRKSNGKLFQGRSLLELVRDLDDHWGRFVEIPARLERIERKVDVLVARGNPRLAKTKLCCSMVPATWPEKRYIPLGSVGGFARLPLPTIAASPCMAAGEYRVLQAILFCAQGTGLLTAGKKRLSKLANVPEAHVKRYLRSLCNRRVIRPTGRILKFGVKEYELLTHPWLCGDISNRGQKTDERGQIYAEGGGNSCPP